MKKILLVFILVSVINSLFAQTIFTYGKDAVSKDEFINAFNRNPNNATDRKKALKEYLDLYINFKLKVKAAYDASLDKDATQQNEVSNFGKQVADNIINQQANVNELVQEAFSRSQKDINLGQVLIEVPENGDSTEAYKKIQQAYKALKDGHDFLKVAEEYSTDAGTKAARGDLGFITAFTLAYGFENIAYSLKPNTISKPYKSKYGYHIFKNLGERKAWGTRKVAQILIAFPPAASEAEKSIALRKADSVYNLINNGASFEELAVKVSNDVSSSNNAGQMPEFGINTYNPVFEQVAFSLKNSGDISKPFATSSGYHIIKVLEAKHVGTDISNTETNEYLLDKVSHDNRIAEAKKLLLAKELKTIKYKPATFNLKTFYEFTDSARIKPSPFTYKGISENTVLFSFAKKNIKAGEWIKFVRSVRGLPEYAGKKMSDIYKDFLQIAADDYYRNHLEDYNASYKKQVKEFKDANLLFEIMEKNVWGKANADTAGLMQYYNQHKTKYVWAPSADAIIITCTNEGQANELQKKLADSLAQWRQITERYAAHVSADSGRYELAQLPVFERTNFTAGLITMPVKNPTDETLTFNYVINVYPETAQRSFEDARGMVISDYQQVLEDKWIAELKKKYPVKVNTAAFNSIK